MFWILYFTSYAYVPDFLTNNNFAAIQVGHIWSYWTANWGRWQLSGWASYGSLMINSACNISITNLCIYTPRSILVWVLYTFAFVQLLICAYPNFPSFVWLVTVSSPCRSVVSQSWLSQACKEGGCQAGVFR